ncbi:sulfotransferase [Myxococcota bacterium]|nr:sulfotransferase [Myxococcota bacterium]
MSWQPPARPDWVEAINAGRVAPISDEADLPLDRDLLMSEARARLGIPNGGVADFCHQDFDADQLLEPLDRLLPALEQEAELSVMGRWLSRRFILRMLEVRLQIIAYLRADPGVRDEPLPTPLFVAGAPRTGTTILYNLLAKDPAHRVPEGWELLRPVPPPDPDPALFAADPRIALADRELRMPQTVVSGLLNIHPYSGRMPKECLSAMSFTFRSEEFTARYHVPSFETWLEQCDMTPAYEMHRLVLQILQRRWGSCAWVLKSPVHLHSLSTLLDVYPDARVAITHRDPLVLLASLTSLIANLRWAHSDHVDYGQIGQSHAVRYHVSLDRLARLTEQGALPAENLHHSRYAQFMSDPMGVVAELYARFGLELSQGAREAMQRSLDDSSRGEGSSHDYAFSDLGLDPVAERAHFRHYQTCFEIPDEKVLR